MAKIAFIGLGHMGGGMAPNLAKAGHEVRAFDLVAEARRARPSSSGCTAAPLGRRGGARTPTSSSPCCPPPSMSAPSIDNDVAPQRQARRAADRLLDHRRRQRARGRRRRCRRQGFDFVDAPVSGGIAAAAGGTLTFMVGGTDEAFERAQAVPRADGQGGDPRRRARRGPGGEDLQQHDPRRDDGRDLRGLRAGAEARARPADLLRHLVQGVGPELVDDQLHARPRRRPRDARRPRL